MGFREKPSKVIGVEAPPKEGSVPVSNNLSQCQDPGNLRSKGTASACLGIRTSLNSTKKKWTRGEFQFFTLTVRGAKTSSQCRRICRSPELRCSRLQAPAIFSLLQTPQRRSEEH